MRSPLEVCRRYEAFSYVLRLATSTDAIGAWAAGWFSIYWFTSVFRASMGLGIMGSGATVHQSAKTTKLICLQPFVVHASLI